MLRSHLNFGLVLLLSIACCFSRCFAEPSSTKALEAEHKYTLDTPVRVLTEHLPPYQIAKHNRLVSGENYRRVRSLFKAAQIPVSFEVMPWARAFKIASEEPNTFIFPWSEAKKEKVISIGSSN